MAPHPLAQHFDVHAGVPQQLHEIPAHQRLHELPPAGVAVTGDPIQFLLQLPVPLGLFLPEPLLQRRLLPLPFGLLLPEPLLQCHRRPLPGFALASEAPFQGAVAPPGDALVAGDTAQDPPDLGGGRGGGAATGHRVAKGSSGIGHGDFVPPPSVTLPPSPGLLAPNPTRITNYILTTNAGQAQKGTTQ